MGEYGVFILNDLYGYPVIEVDSDKSRGLLDFASKCFSSAGSDVLSFIKTFAVLYNSELRIVIDAFLFNMYHYYAESELKCFVEFLMKNDFKFSVGVTQDDVDDAVSFVESRTDFLLSLAHGNMGGVSEFFEFIKVVRVVNNLMFLKVLREFGLCDLVVDDVVIDAWVLLHKSGVEIIWY